ncbi:MAG: carboxypeptidase-like regulatory domain-containing protein, partial [Odoribacter sp.]|nr:carboxypeptidase-like regulatory domain-containing protein [Odoribacter sp.]
MKKICKYCRRRMKIFDWRFLLAAIMVGAVLCVPTGGMAQKAVRQHVTLELKDATLTRLFEEIMKQTDYRFFFNDVQERSFKGITISVEHERLDSVLTHVFQGSRYTYRMVGVQVVIVERPVELPNQNVKRADVTLLVRDSTEGYPLVGVACIMSELGIYGVTDVNGVAVLRQVPLGENELNLSFLGYENYRKMIDVKENFSLEVKLVETSLALD